MLRWGIINILGFAGRSANILLLLIYKLSLMNEFINLAHILVLN